MLALIIVHKGTGSGGMFQSTSTMRSLLLAITLATIALADYHEKTPCSCNLQTLWVDVIVLLDNSRTTGIYGTNALLDYVKETFENVNVMKRNDDQTMYTMVGIITYSYSSTINNRLGTMNSTDLQNLDIQTDMNYNSTGTTSAIASAMDQFARYGRPNTRKVILLAAADYNNNTGGWDDPRIRAQEFKKAGIIAVYDYTSQTHPANSMLQELASPGYYSTNVQIPRFNMSQALCYANCFCPTFFSTISTNSPMGYPTSDCYQYMENSINYNRAQSNCGRYAGIVAMDKTADKENFLTTLVPSFEKYWAGFNWDSVSNSWMWSDGQKVSSSYQPWLISADHTTGIDCAFVQQVQGKWNWTQDYCTSAYTFVCQQPACDSGNYCTVPYP